MNEIKKLLNLSINNTENHYKIKYSTKLNMIVYIMILLNTLMKTKMNLFYKNEY